MEQLGTLYDWVQSLSNAQAKDTLDHINIKKDITLIQGELAGIGRRGEDPTLSTTQKINRERARYRDWGAWFIDRVLPQIVTLITLAILYMTFGGKLP